MKILTRYIFPPMPIREFDWQAYDDDAFDAEIGDDGAAVSQSSIGYGRTAWAAVADLLQQLEDDERATREELDAAFAEWWERHNLEAKERHDHARDEHAFEVNYTNPE